ncbi:expressed unknown protein [Seminavis robusta]|uniref:Uncharacterized protein n=1 Tax=Seminavis robusta TaxID=568900 RepID=A0A9N8HUP2_9STRA|nr:expressed unknown protein [Seminavis robusta]|eukprot:Sro1786_g297430.1 n/a (565) ;mRNA; f:10359-12053
MATDTTFRVDLMSCIVDTAEEQQSCIQAVQSFPNLRNLKIRLSGWALPQNNHVRVGINTVSSLLEAVTAKGTMEELTIDLGCLSQEENIAGFCNTLASSETLQSLTIACSGEESISKQGLRDLGKAFRTLHSVETLKLSGMDPEHLSVILQNMQLPQASCPCVPACKRQCPRVVSHCNCEEGPNSEQQTERGYPKNVEIEKSRLFHRAMTYLVYLVMDEKQSSISNLTIRDCVHYTEDLGCLTFLLKGQSILEELTLERLRVCSFPGASSPFWSPCSVKELDNLNSAVSDVLKLSTVKLIDCKGSMTDVETMIKAMVQNPNLEQLVLQYSTPDTCATTIHALNTIHQAMVIDNLDSSLRQLQVLAGPQMEAYRLHKLVELLGHPKCILESLTLDLGAGPYQLDVLSDNFAVNTRLQHLSVSGDEALDVTTLECFVEMLSDAPQLTSLELDFPGTHETNAKVVQVFRANTTLQSIRVHPASSGSTHLSFFGLRNQVRHLLLSQDEWSGGTWCQVLQLLLDWQEQPPPDVLSRLGTKRKDLVMLSALWFALMECPSLVSELEPLAG